MLRKEQASGVWLWESFSAALPVSRDLQGRDFPRQKFCLCDFSAPGSRFFQYPDRSVKFLWTFNFCHIVWQKPPQFAIIYLQRKGDLHLTTSITRAKKSRLVGGAASSSHLVCLKACLSWEKSSVSIKKYFSSLDILYHTLKCTIPTLRRQIQLTAVIAS